MWNTPSPIMKDRTQFQFPLATIVVFTLMIAVGFALFRLVFLYNGVLASETPSYVPYVTITMYIVFGSAIGFAVAAMRSKRLLRGAIIGSLVPILYFAVLWVLLNGPWP